VRKLAAKPRSLVMQYFEEEVYFDFAHVGQQAIQVSGEAARPYRGIY
jgi:hypothetical protein